MDPYYLSLMSNEQKAHMRMLAILADVADAQAWLDDVDRQRFSNPAEKAYEIEKRRMIIALAGTRGGFPDASI